MYKSAIKQQTFLVSACLLTLLGQGLPAKQVSAFQIDGSAVKAAVSSWLRSETANARVDAAIELMEPWYADGELIAYIAHLRGGGFCLCGADSLVLPVYYYSPEGEFDSDSEDYKYILWEIGARKRHLQESGMGTSAEAATANARALEDREAYWQRLISGDTVNPMPDQAAVESAAPSTLILDLSSRWGQGSPYNDLCPNLTPGANEHVQAGCVAISTAQIMNYWQWPSTGVGVGSQDYNFRWRTNWDSIPLAVNPNTDLGSTSWSWESGRLEWSNADGGNLRITGYWDHSLYLSARRINDSDTAFLTALTTLWDRLLQASSPNTANFGATTYNWAIMPDAAVDPPDAGSLEAAKLIYHAGIATKMNWGVWVSTSGTPSAVSALKDHFRYDPDGSVSTASSAMLIEELQWLRPAFLDGCRSTGGCHVWVVVGYNLGVAPDHQFYINLGWGGGNEGWYTLDSMEFNFSQSQGTHVAPIGVKFVGAAAPGDGSPDAPYADIDEAMIEAPDHTTLIFKTGSNNTFAGDTLVLNRPVTLKGYDVYIE